LPPSPALAEQVAQTRARALLEKIPAVPPHRLGPHADAWSRLVATLPALLRSDSNRLLAALHRVDVYSTLAALAHDRIGAPEVERALTTLYIALARHPGLTSPLILPGPLRERTVHPFAPRIVELGNVRGLAATARGAVVLADAGHTPLDAYCTDELPSLGRTVIVDAQLRAPDGELAVRVQQALASALPALPGGAVERVTIGSGEARFGEAIVGADANPADIVHSSGSAFARAAAALQPVVGEGGSLIERGSSVSPIDVVARAAGNAMALPWRPNRQVAEDAIRNDLDELALLAEPTPAGAEFLTALRVIAGRTDEKRPRVLLINVDNDDFVYAFQFGRSVERRCRERGLRVDRIAISPTTGRDLAAELGEPVPPPVADGTETLVASEADDVLLAAALQRLSRRRYRAVVANVRPRLFYDLLAHGYFAAPTLLWDRHLHGGLAEEGARRGIDARALGSLPIEAWSLDRHTGPGVQRNLAAAGFQRGSGRIWPLDLGYFRSAVPRQPGRIFAGGDNQRDWPLLMEAIRDLPVELHLVSQASPAELPANVRAERRLPLGKFRDAMASATIAAIPLLADAAAGVSVIPMAMALGVAVVATRTPWTEPLIEDGREGLLVEPGDARGLHDALLRLHEQPELRSHLVANAREKVVAACDLEAFTCEMFATLD
jgi:hypothetical protein